MTKLFKYDGFIQQNIAPLGATGIILYEDEVVKGGIPLGTLTRPKDEKLFSIGLLSDIHCDGTAGRTFNNFNRALTYFEQQSCVMCCHAGDMNKYMTSNISISF